MTRRRQSGAAGYGRQGKTAMHAATVVVPTQGRARSMVVVARGQEQRFTSHMDDAEAIHTLRNLIGNGGPLSRSNFALSLASQWARRGLSQRQWPWVHKLVVDVQERERAAAQPQAAPAGPNVAAVVDMLRRASEHLRWPRITVRVPDGSGTVRMAYATRGRVPGSVNVTSDAAYGSALYYGRLMPTG